MKIKKPYLSKSLKSKESHKTFSGESSPYQKFMQNCQANDKSGTFLDDPLANLDVFSEEDSIYHRPLTKQGELQRDAIEVTMAKLSSQQQKVIELCGYEGHTLKEAALILHVKPTTIQTLLNRARKRIKQEYQRQIRLQ